MDVYEIVNALNQILNLGDSLDDTGVVGVKHLPMENAQPEKLLGLN